MGLLFASATPTTDVAPNPATQGVVQRCGATQCAPGTCDHESEATIRRKPAAAQTTARGAVPSIVHNVVRSRGETLPTSVRKSMESRFGHDFSRVRVHSDARASESARVIQAEAYTVGRHVVFRSGRYAPTTTQGSALLAHELTHVVQQGADSDEVGARLTLGPLEDFYEREADRVMRSSGTVPRSTAAQARDRVQRQFVTPMGPGGGWGGVMDRDRRRAYDATSGGTAPAAATPFQVCSRDLQGILGIVGNHAYIEAPPHRYAVISPLCPASKWDNPVTGTTAQKWDNSPDPCGKEPHCVPCHPRPGVSNVAACLHAAFTAYNNPSLYRGLGPNSNTFAGTLARSCCDAMIPKPAALGNCPGWNDAPAPARAGATPCPPGPTC